MIDTHIDRYLELLWARRQVILRGLLKNQTGLSPASSTGAAFPNPTKVTTPEQYTIITVLHSFGHGVPVKEIAERADSPHANITRTLDRLEKKGLVHRTRSKKDKRQMIVRLTLEGKKTAKNLIPIREKLWASLWGELDETEKVLFLELMEKALSI